MSAGGMHTTEAPDVVWGHHSPVSRQAMSIEHSYYQIPKGLALDGVNPPEEYGTKTKKRPQLQRRIVP